MICEYCGLESGDATNHGSPEACIQALERELARLQRILAHGAFAIPGCEPHRDAVEPAPREARHRSAHPRH